MELLLILSAMLSAVTGAFSGVSGATALVWAITWFRPAQPAAAVTEQQVAPAVADRPAGTVSTIELPELPGFALAAAIPLYADRLIE